MQLMPPPLGLYIHFPWCVRKCPYCDFNSHQLKGEIPEKEYIDALLDDLESDLPLVWGRTVSTVFMGGGTPSLFSPTAMDRLLSGVRARLPLKPEAEITMEANPGTLEYAPMDEFHSAGINRLSIGVQSFNDALLSKIGRIHSADEAELAVNRAREGGFERINIDLMYALPGQSVEQACDDVRRALSLPVSHLSHYQLTIEPNTLFHARPPVLPQHDEAWISQEACQQLIEQAGFVQYEVSAYASADDVCRHNLNYWQFGDYLGIGAGAHGKITSGAEQCIRRTLKQRHPARWLQASASERTVETRLLSEDDLRFEFVLNALRLNDGFDTALFEQRTGLSLDPDCQPWRALLEDDMLEHENGAIRTSIRGRNFLNEITERFL